MKTTAQTGISLLCVLRAFAVAFLVFSLSASAGVITNVPPWYAAAGLSLEDTDGDGVPDAWEKRTFGDPLCGDADLIDRDNDGLSDYEEFLYGSDPRTSRASGELTESPGYLESPDQSHPPLYPHMHKHTRVHQTPSRPPDGKTVTRKERIT